MCKTFEFQCYVLLYILSLQFKFLGKVPRETSIAMSSPFHVGHSEPSQQVSLEIQDPRERVFPYGFSQNRRAWGPFPSTSLPRGLSLPITLGKQFF